MPIKDIKHIIYIDINQIILKWDIKKIKFQYIMININIYWYILILIFIAEKSAKF